MSVVANSRFTFDGLEALRAELRNLPSALTQEAGDIIADSTRDAGDALEGRYPKRTGNLKRGVRRTIQTQGYRVIGTVKNVAPHAWLFENGSQARHTEIGANRGSMPPGHVFVPIMERFRRFMYEDLKALLVKHGMQVSGNG